MKVNTKNIIKWILILAVIALMAGIMWKHKNTAAGNHTAAAVGTAEQVTFPEEVKEQVTDNFSYDAKITLEKDFDSASCHVATASVQQMNKDGWKKLFLKEDRTWSEEEDTTTDREENVIPETIYTDEDGSVLYLSDEDGMYYQYPDMKYIEQIFDISPYATIKNEFSLENELPGKSRQQAEEEVKDTLAQLGVKKDEVVVKESYALDLETIKRKEQEYVGINAVAEEEKNPSWEAGDEGYYMFLEQKVQGLPIFTAGKVQDFELNGIGQSDVEVFDTGKGIKRLSVSNWFDVTFGEEVYQLLPFEEIMKTMNQRMEHIEGDGKMTVTECRLYEYPQLVNEKEYQLRPVWICTVSISQKGEEAVDADKIYIPIDAVTGEEVLDMEE